MGGELAKIENLQLRQVEDGGQHHAYSLQVASIAQARSIAQLMVEATDPDHPDNKMSSKAVLILAGMEMGMSAVRATQELFIDERTGKVGQLVVATRNEIARDPRYDYEVLEVSEDKASVQFYKIVDGKRVPCNGGKPIVRTKEWAQKAGKYKRPEYEEKTGKNGKPYKKLKGGNKNYFLWESHGANMLLWQAIRDGAKFFCPGLFNGYAIYDEQDAAEIEGDVAHDPVGNVAEIIATERAATTGDAVEVTAEDVLDAREEIAKQTGDEAELKKVDGLRNIAYIEKSSVPRLIQAGAGRWTAAQVIAYVRKTYDTPSNDAMRLTLEQAEELRGYLSNPENKPE